MVGKITTRSGHVDKLRNGDRRPLTRAMACHAASMRPRRVAPLLSGRRNPKTSTT